MELDLEVSDLSINVADVESILPEGTLPDNLNLPDLRIRNARISGTAENLNFDIPLETDNGVWQLKGKLELGALNISADLTGQLEPAMNLTVDAQIGNEAVGQFADLNALVQDGSYAADFAFTHPDFLATGQGSYAIGADSVASVDATVQLERVDLQQWDITEAPMVLKGGIRAESQGLDPYNMNGFVRMDTVRLQGEDGSSYVDSLLLTASLQDRNNEIYIFGSPSRWRTANRWISFSSSSAPNPSREDWSMALRNCRPSPPACCTATPARSSWLTWIWA